jgi:hypothetical protein
MYYFFDDNHTRIESETFPANTYALGGFRDANDAGKLTVHYLNALRPLYSSKSGKQVVMPEKAGQTFQHGRWLRA